MKFPNYIRKNNCQNPLINKKILKTQFFFKTIEQLKDEIPTQYNSHQPNQTKSNNNIATKVHNRYNILQTI